MRKDHDDSPSGKWSALIGKKVSTGRASSKLTQGELADKMGISRVAISAIETGRFGISLTRLLELAIVLGREPSTLLPTLAELKGCETEDAAQVINRYYGDANAQKTTDQGGTGG